VKYGIFSLESGNALEWFDSDDDAIDALKRLVAEEPEAVEAVGVMEFDDAGHPTWSLFGAQLVQALNTTYA
jgi:hypothetical protein